MPVKLRLTWQFRPNETTKSFRDKHPKTNDGNLGADRVQIPYYSMDKVDRMDM
jgi:hypothetical protein